MVATRTARPLDAGPFTYALDGASTMPSRWYCPGMETDRRGGPRSGSRCGRRSGCRLRHPRPHRTPERRVRSGRYESQRLRNAATGADVVRADRDGADADVPGTTDTSVGTSTTTLLCPVAYDTASPRAAGTRAAGVRAGPDALSAIARRWATCYEFGAHPSRRRLPAALDAGARGRAPTTAPWRPPPRGAPATGDSGRLRAGIWWRPSRTTRNQPSVCRPAGRAADVWEIVAASHHDVADRLPAVGAPAHVAIKVQRGTSPRVRLDLLAEEPARELEAKCARLWV